MKKNVSIPYMLMGILFVVCLIASNLLETKVTQVVIGSFHLTLTGGLLIFPVSYIINDCITEIWGYKKTRLIIWVGFAMTFFVAGMGQLAAIIPAADFWDGGEHFNYIFGLVPRISIASLCAFLLGSFINAYIMSRMKIKSKGKNFSLRAIVSTVFGESADSIIFFPIAFGGLMPVNELVKIGLIQIVLKSVYEVIILPITIITIKYVKKIDHSDVYDEGISYNPLKLKDV